MEDALALARHHGAALNEAETLRALAEWAAARADATAARVYAGAALRGFEALGASADAAELSQWMLQTLPTDSES